MFQDLMVEVEANISQETKVTLAKICDVYGLTQKEMQAADDELQILIRDDRMSMQAREFASLLGKGLRVMAEWEHVHNRQPAPEGYME